MSAKRILVIGVLTLALVWVTVTSVSFFRDDPPSDVERANDKAVADAALIALARGEMRAVKALMTERGWAQIERELRALRDQLADPAGHPSVAGLVEVAREKLGADADAAIAEVRGGGSNATWKFLLKLYPMDDPPRYAGVFADPKRPEEKTWFYWGPTGVRRSINLVRRRGSWYVDAIGLL